MRGMVVGLLILLAVGLALLIVLNIPVGTS